MDADIEKFTSRNIVVIEDITHRLLCEQSHCKNADYLVGSLRKWFPIPSGGLAIKVNGHFRNSYLIPPPVELVRKKVRAMRKRPSILNSQRNQIVNRINVSFSNCTLSLIRVFVLTINARGWTTCR